MSLNLNHITLAGRLTRDPETRAVGEGKNVTSFTLAVNRRWKDTNGDPHDEVLFVDCEAWNRTGELVQQYLTKGSPCYVEGRLRLDRWTDPEGKERSRMKVVVTNLQFLGSKGGPSDSGADSDDVALPDPVAAPSSGRASARPVVRTERRSTVDSAPF